MVSSGSQPDHLQCIAIVRLAGDCALTNRRVGRPKVQVRKGRRMEMRRIRTITTILMMLGLCGGLAHGQKGTPGVKVTVPFPFVIQRTTLSSGDYSFFSSRDKVWIQEANGRNVAVLLTGAQDGRVAEKNS